MVRFSKKARHRRNTNKPLIVLAVFGLLAVAFAQLCAQQPYYAEEWRWVSFTTESNLPSDHVINILESPSGIVWVQTTMGIAWYDGYQWVQSDTASDLPSRYASLLGEGFGEDILVLSGGKLYNGNRERFHLLLSQPISNAVAYQNNSYLILANSRLFILDKGALSPLTLSADSSEGEILTLWKTKGGTIWVNTSAGLYRFENGHLALQLRATPVHFSVNNLIEDDHGTGIVSIGTPVELRGLWEWKNHELPKKDPNEKGDFIRSADIGPEDQLIAIHQSGEVRIRLKDEWFTVNTLQGALRNPTIVKFRKNGDLWVGTEHGLFLYRFSSSRWTYKKYDKPDPRNRIHEILQTKNGDLWLATAEGIEVHKANGGITTINDIDGTKLWEVTGLIEDDAGTIWVSSGYAPGVYSWNGKKWNHLIIGEGANSIRVHKIRNDHFGNLWFLGLSISNQSYTEDQAGAFFYSGGRLTHWGAAEGLTNGRVYSFAEGTDGALWFGTFGGLHKWKNGTWTHWTKDQGLRGDKVFCLAVDQDNTIWFGDQRSGLGYLDDKGIIRYLTTADGLIDNRIWDLRVDAKGKLWIATEGGLGSYYKGTWSTFDTRTGLNNPVLWPILPIGDKVYVGTIGSGLAILNLDESVQPPPRIFLNPPLSHDGGTLVRWHPLSYWGELPSNEIMTRYRLDGARWSEWNPNREVEFNDLASGPHTFEVQAKGLFGDFDPTGKNETFLVALPFYKEPVFLLPIISLALAVIGLAIIIIRRKRIHDALLRESEAKFRAVTETTSSAILIVQDSEFQYLNKGAELLTGYSKEELFKKDFLEIIHPDFRNVIVQRRQARKQGAPVSPRFEFKIISKNGEERWIDYTSVDIVYEGKSAFLGTAFDITERVRAEESIRTQQLEQQVLLDHVPAMIWYKDTENRILRLNQPAADSMGKSIPELEGKSMYELYPEEAAKYHADDLEVINSGIPKFGIIEVLQTSTGDKRWVHTDKIPYQREDGKIIGVIVFSQDITERRRSDILQSALYKIEKAAETTERLEDLYRSVHDIIRDVMPAENFYLALYDSTENVISFPYFVDEEDETPLPRTARKGLTEYVLRTGKSLLCTMDDHHELMQRGEADLYGPPSPIWLGVPLILDKKPIGVMTVQHYSDAKAYGERERQMLEFVSSQVAKAIQRKRADKALHDSEERYRTLFEESEDTVFISSPSGNLIDINAAGLQLFGYDSREELLKVNIGADLYLNPDDREAAQQQLLESGFVKDFEFTVKRKDGQRRIVHETARVVRDPSGAIIAYRGILRDITEQKKLEQQLIQAQKMESIGTLAGGIAHDFNNILTIILGYASVIERRSVDQESFVKNIEAIRKAALRGAGVVNQLLTFARKTDFAPVSTDLNAVILDLYKLVEATFPKTITIDSQLDQSLPHVICDQNQIHQALLNLCVNARDAMPNGGTLSLQTMITEGGLLREKHPLVKAMQYATIRIIDTGMGMDEHTRQRIFEPFFTTKGIGKGTGLGLALVYGVVESHSGFIDVDSSKDIGTVFSLHFPVPGSKQIPEESP